MIVTFKDNTITAQAESINDVRTLLSLENRTHARSPLMCDVCKEVGFKGGVGLKIHQALMHGMKNEGVGRVIHTTPKQNTHTSV